MPNFRQLIVIRYDNGHDMLIGLDRDGEIWRATINDPERYHGSPRPTIHWEQFQEV